MLHISINIIIKLHCSTLKLPCFEVSQLSSLYTSFQTFLTTQYMAFQLGVSFPLVMILILMTIILEKRSLLHNIFHRILLLCWREAIVLQPWFECCSSSTFDLLDLALLGWFCCCYSPWNSLIQHGSSILTEGINPTSYVSLKENLHIAK